MRVLALLLVSLVSFLTLGADAHASATPAPPRVGEAEAPRLEAGEKLVYATVDNLNRGEVIGVVDATMDEVLAVLRDYDNYRRWYPDQRASALLWRRDSNARARGEIRMPVPFPNRHFEIDVTQESRTVDGQRVVTVRWQYVEDSGNFREMYGFWWLQPWQGDTSRTLCRYVLYADLGVWLPAFVIRWAQRRMLPGIIDGIRAEVVLRRS